MSASPAGDNVELKALANDDGDRIVQVPVWSTPWNVKAAECVVNKVIGGHPGDGGWETAVDTLIPLAKTVHWAQHTTEPDGDACGCEEAGWWCELGDGPKRAFFLFDGGDIRAAEDAANDDIEAAEALPGPEDAGRFPENEAGHACRRDAIVDGICIDCERPPHSGSSGVQP